MTPGLFERITAKFEPQAMPLCHVPMALRMIDHSTDCVWHDAYSDMAYGPTIQEPWGIRGIEWLREEYEKAQEISADVVSLLEWIEASQENRLRLLQVWEQALEAAPMTEDEHGD
jgi:hypothetical protein